LSNRAAQITPKATGIVAAGGQGTRLGIAGGKQLLELADKPIVAWSIDALASAELIQDIVVVCDPDRVGEYAQVITAKVSTKKPLNFVAGGETREESVMAGLLSVDKAADIVAIHDGARPLLEGRHVDSAIQALIEKDGLDGVVLGNPAVDTLKRVKGDLILDTPDRDQYWHAQTPQIFWKKQLFAAYKQAREEGYQGTDDASYCENSGGKVGMVLGSRNNLKITTTEDIDFAESLLTKTGESPS